MKGETGLSSLLGSETVKDNRIKRIGAHLKVGERKEFRVIDYPIYSK